MRGQWKAAASDRIDGDFTEAYKYYFDNIIGPYKNPHMLNALKKIENLEIQFIGNGHGPVLRRDIPKYLEMYRQWSAPAPKQDPAVAICYVSAYGYTGRLAQAIRQGLEQGGIQNVQTFDLVTDDKTQAAAAAAAADGLLLGSPTLIGDALPPVYEMLLGLNPVIHRGKFAGAFGSYAWSGEAAPNLLERMRALRFNLPLPALRVKLMPTEEDLENARTFGKEFAAAMLNK